MKVLGGRRIAAIALVASALVAAMAYTLVSSQHRAEALLLQRYADRAKLAAGFTSSVLGTSAQQNIDGFRKQLSVPPDQLRAGLRGYLEGEDAFAAVVDSRGRTLAALPNDDMLAGRAQQAALRRALAGRTTISDVFDRNGSRPSTSRFRTTCARSGGSSSSRLPPPRWSSSYRPTSRARPPCGAPTRTCSTAMAG